MAENILPGDGDVFYFPNFFSKEESEHYFLDLKTSIPWKQEPVLIFGKHRLQPRLTALCGDPSKPLKYSGITMQPSPWNSTLLTIKEKVEQATEVRFTTVLLNYYRSGEDSMGWHRDNESELGENPVIASVSFGASRVFCFRHYYEKSVKEKLILENGSLLLMQKNTQHNWEHSLPKQRGSPSDSQRERLNLTFRVLI